MEPKPNQRGIVIRNQWLSSDYMFNALRHDHNYVQKRLGDGFYEQRLGDHQNQS